MSVIPDQWKADALSSALTCNQVGQFHRQGMVYTVNVVLAVPSK